jgi:hypothetical protein
MSCMMKKLAKVGYRVAPMYSDEPNGTIVEVINDEIVMVRWDYGVDPKPYETREMVKFLRKGV